MPKKLLLPEGVQALLARRFERQRATWLAGEGTWPLDVNLGAPTQQDVEDDPPGVRAWVDAWTARTGPGELSWIERRFGRLGTHRFPVLLRLDTPEQVALELGQGERWASAKLRHRRMSQRWPSLSGSRGLASQFDILAEWSAEDFERLFSLIAWLDANPVSGLSLRQLPVEGLDTKWVGQRREVVTGVIRQLREAPPGAGFHELCGLRKAAHRIRMRVLCPDLRRQLGGLHDIESPVDELAALPIAPTRSVIVENLETGLALPDMPGTVAIMKLGNAVGALDKLGWLRDTTAVYWGDIDTHGLAILDRARRVLPRLRSVLMDEATLLEHRRLWGREPSQCPELDLALLDPQESALYRGLRDDVWGAALRLEQERLPWEQALAAIQAAFRASTDDAAMGHAG